MSAARRPLVPEHVENLKPYQPGLPNSELIRLYGVDRIVRLNSNENPFGPSPLAVEAAREALGDIHRYGNAGADLRRTLAEWHHVRPENVTVGNGSESILANILRTFPSDGDRMLTSEGTFVTFHILAQARGLPVDLVPHNDYALDLSAIADAITERTKIIYLVNPNNPTGTRFTRAEFEPFMARVPEDVLVILDEAYIEFAGDDPDFPDSMQYRFDNVITLRTFSKAYGMAALRLGYGMAHDRLIEQINKIKLPFEPNGPAAAAGQAALHDRPFVDRTLANNAAGLAALYPELDALGLRYKPSSANFVMVETDSHETVTRLHESLMRQGVLIRPLVGFRLPHCYRISIGLPDEMTQFVAALKRTLAEQPATV